MQKEIVIVGANGHMGSAISERMRNIGLTQGVHELVRRAADYDAVVQSGDVILSCMKQKDTINWFQEHGGGLKEGSIVLVLGAFLSTEVLEHACENASVRIGRFMGTTAIRTGADEIVWTSDGKFTDTQKQEVQVLLEALGAVQYLGERNDTEINKKTYRACMPGLMADACEAAIIGLVSVGLNREEAEEAIDNANNLLHDQRNQGLSYLAIRNNVMSAKGLTEAAYVARKDQMYWSVRVGMHAMVRRGEEIAEQFGQKKGA